MARGSIYNLDQPLYSAANGAGGGRVPGITPGGQTRESWEPDPKWSGIVPGQGPEYGQQQYSPGQSYSPFQDMVTMQGQNPNTGSIFSYYDITNLGGLMDWWESDENQGGWYSQFDDFWDFYNYYNTGYGGAGAHQEQPGYGGGSQGGAGDLGTGNVFLGGGPGGEMSGQDCATLGPQFNTQGECISCCGEQYAGAGFYGTGEEYEGGGDYTIDPNMDTDCAGLYSQSGGYDFTNLSYSEFESMYC